MYGNEPCNSCGTRAIDMPTLQENLKFIEEIKAIQNASKPNKGTGCIVMLIDAFVMFGIPGIFMYFGDSVISYVIVSALLLLINLKLFTYRRGMTFKAKDINFTLSKQCCLMPLRLFQMIAVYEMNLNRILDLLNRGADVKLKNKAGQNAYDVARDNLSRHIHRAVESENLDEGGISRNMTSSKKYFLILGK